MADTRVFGVFLLQESRRGVRNLVVEELNNFRLERDARDYVEEYIGDRPNQWTYKWRWRLLDCSDPTYVIIARVRAP